MISLALHSFLTLLVVLDPIGMVPPFLALTAERPRDEQVRIALRSVLVAGAVLLAFALGGSWLLSHLGITLEAFRVAGGILLFRIAVGMVFAQHERGTEEEQEEARSRGDISVFPLAIPLMAGPGAMATIMILASQAEGVPMGLPVVLAMAAVNLVIMYLALRLGPPLSRLLGQTGVNVITRVLGVLLAALAVQYVADGGRALLAGPGPA